MNQGAAVIAPAPVAHWHLSCLAAVIMAMTLDALAKRERVYRILELGNGTSIAKRLFGDFVPGARWTQWHAGQWTNHAPGSGSVHLSDPILDDPAPTISTYGQFDVMLSIGAADPFGTEQLRATIDRSLAVARNVAVLLPLSPTMRRQGCGLEAHQSAIFRRDLNLVALSVNLGSDASNVCGFYLLSQTRDSRHFLEILGRQVLERAQPSVDHLSKSFDVLDPMQFARMHALLASLHPQLASSA